MCKRSVWLCSFARKGLVAGGIACLQANLPTTPTATASPNGTLLALRRPRTQEIATTKVLHCAEHAGAEARQLGENDRRDDSAVIPSFRRRASVLGSQAPAQGPRRLAPNGIASASGQLQTARALGSAAVHQRLSRDDPYRGRAKHSHLKRAGLGAEHLQPIEPFRDGESHEEAELSISKVDDDKDRAMCGAAAPVSEPLLARS